MVPYDYTSFLSTYPMQDMLKNASCPLTVLRGVVQHVSLNDSKNMENVLWLYDLIFLSKKGSVIFV